MNNYRCPGCEEQLPRDSSKKWILSYCQTTGEYRRIQLVKNILENIKDLDPEFSKTVDENFFELIDDYSRKGETQDNSNIGLKKEAAEWVKEAEEEADIWHKTFGK